MIQPKEVHALAGKTGVRDTQIEKDYVISWVLWGISKNEFLRENLVFKGGTVLKKAYFPGYRYSEELEFTFSGEMNASTVKDSFTGLIVQVHDASGITLSMEGEKQPETGNFNFFISYTGPLARSGTNKEIKVVISKDELMYHQPEEKKIIAQYSDLVNEEYSMLCYPIDEIAAEKMRLLMQRTAPRDVYDIWYLFEMHGHAIEDSIFAFLEKTKFKKMDPQEFTGVIEKKEAAFAKHWKDHLSHQMAALPEFKKVWRELEKSWRRMEKFTSK